MYEILVVNPGSTSTKVGWFENEERIFVENISHSKKEIQVFKKIIDQLSFRRNAILDLMKEKNRNIQTLDAVVGRGGLLRPIESGTYLVNEKMLEDLRRGHQGEHASNLGGILANEIAKEVSIPAYIVDPVVVDEMEPVARITGRPEIMRRSIFHALNHKATARNVAEKIGRKYEDLNLIVAHLGGGISIGAHKKGRVVDVNNALNGDGPFGPERAGGLPVWDTVNYFLSNDFSPQEIKKKLAGDAGVSAHLGTNDMMEVVERIEEGDKKAEDVFNALIYQVSKEIGKLAPVFFGKVDGIVLTGGLAREEKFTEEIEKRVGFIAPLYICPGEDEMKALALGAIRALNGEEEAKEY
ncbi:butyrate kinase [candidate division WOR-3 bacterium]|nr:butyrate kinase [candidate division WOR-3 bacterium]MCK4526662.1 butyrate kinase [candidate division WOR-3 bacterium]